MPNTSFKFNKSQYDAIKKACNNVSKDIIQMAQGKENITSQLGEDYRVDVRNAILTQKFPRSFKPYSKKYAKWKSSIPGFVPAPAFWFLSGSVVKNLKIKRVGSGTTLSGLMVSRAHRKDPYMTKGGHTHKNGPLSGMVKQTNATNYAVIVNAIRPLFGPIFDVNRHKYSSKIHNTWVLKLHGHWK